MRSRKQREMDPVDAARRKAREKYGPKRPKSTRLCMYVENAKGYAAKNQQKVERKPTKSVGPERPKPTLTPS